MKIVNIIGGLGNQMFQYAFAVALKEMHPKEDILIDIQHFNHYPLHNGYELQGVFPNLSLKVAKRRQIIKVSWYVPHYKLSRFVRKLLPLRKTEFMVKNDFGYYPEALKKEGNMYYDGYWQAHQYYDGLREKLIHEFAFPLPNKYNREMAEKIRNCESVGIHVRRGDYVGNVGFGGICNEEYYKQAISKIRVSKESIFYIFTNDASWCRKYLESYMTNVVYVNENKGKDSFWDMYLMTQCRQLILANSSFSWWSAYLNMDVEKVVAPKLWVRDKEWLDTQLPEWTLI